MSPVANQGVLEAELATLYLKLGTLVSDNGIVDVSSLDSTVDFTLLQTVFNKGLEYKFARTISGRNILKDAQTKSEFDTYVKSFLPTLVKQGKTPEDFAKVISIVGNVIEKKFEMTSAMYLEQPHKLRRTLKDMIWDSQFSGNLGNKHNLNRWFLYHDTDIYTAMPFSPPSEELHRVIKLEVGNGCNTGGCTYCTVYGEAPFFIRSPEEFEVHAKQVAEQLGKDLSSIERVFLAGGNVFSLPTKKLMEYVLTTKQLFRDGYRNNDGASADVRRIAAFGRTEGILSKSVSELDELDYNRFHILFWGIESGSDEVLRYVNKRTTFKKMLEAGKKINESRMGASIMIMPGLGGLKHYKSHVQRTVDLLNAIEPRYITFLSVNATPQSQYTQRMNEEMRSGENRPLTDPELVEQMYDIVSGISTKQKCLVAAYQLPVEHVATNPVEFRGYLNFGQRGYMEEKIIDYFISKHVSPSNDLPRMGGWFRKSMKSRIKKQKRRY